MASRAVFCLVMLGHFGTLEALEIVLIFYSIFYHVPYAFWGRLGSQRGAKRETMGALWKHMFEISEKVEIVLSPAREHHFQGLRGSRRASD